MKKKINIGLIGHKFMGKAHSHAYKDLNMFFELKSDIIMHTLCGVEDDLWDTAEKYGFLNAEKNWVSVVNNPDIDIIDICTPDSSHVEIAVAAAQAGKHIICEKPMAINYSEACEMFRAVIENNVKNMCNFVYRGVPAIKLAKSIINSGKIGEIYNYRAQYLQDFALSPEFPFVWRMDKKVAGAGIIGDKGAHVIDLARYLVGEINEVAAQSKVLMAQRKTADGTGVKNVTTSDTAIFMANFENGALGIFELSNMAAGRKNAMLIEINGSMGSIVFDLERLNELKVYYAKDDLAEQGFKTINVTEKAHEYMANWWPSGHILGWEHAFLHQLYELIRAVENDTQNESNFIDGMKCQRIVEAIAKSDEQHNWVKISEIGV